MDVYVRNDMPSEVVLYVGGSDGLGRPAFVWLASRHRGHWDEAIAERGLAEDAADLRDLAISWRSQGPIPRAALGRRRRRPRR